MHLGRRVAAVLLVAAAASGSLAAPIDAQGVDEEAAERAAEEIQAARDRANAAAESYLQAEIELEQLQDRSAELSKEATALEQEVATLRAEAADVAIDRFTASGSVEIPLLTDAGRPSDRLQATVLANVALDTTADATDEYELAQRELDELRAEVDDNQRELRDQQAAYDSARRNAEAEVERLKEIEEERLRDEQVRIALERKQAEERRQREAEEAARRAAAEREAAEREAAALAAAAARAAQPAPQQESDDDDGGSSGPLPAAPSPSDDGGDGGGGGNGDGGQDEPDPPAAPPSSGGGFACPVQGASAYADTWGAPRSGGRTHEGVDLIAAHGTPLVAVEAGSVQFKQTRLGGNSVWLTGATGTRYFYAHLASFEGGSRSVSKGELIGYVGATGNANGTNHLHFEVHPGGGAAVNPTPFVRNAGC